MVPMPCHKLLDDAGFPAIDEGVLRDDILNRVTNRADALAVGQSCEGCPQRLARHSVQLTALTQQILVHSRDCTARTLPRREVRVGHERIADNHAEGRVSMPLASASLDVRATVKGDEVARG